MYDTPQTDHSVTLDERGEVSFSFDGKEVSVSLYETPDLTEEEALQIVEMYADQLSEHVTGKSISSILTFVHRNVVNCIIVNAKIYDALFTSRTQCDRAATDEVRQRNIYVRKPANGSRSDRRVARLLR